VSEIAKEPQRVGSPKKAAALKKEFGDAVNDDLNTSRALATAWEVIKSGELSGAQKKALLFAFDKVLGLNLKEFAARRRAVVVSPEAERLAEERELCRRNKQFAQADALRNEIHALGYEVDDTPQGPLVKPLPSHAPHATSNKDSSAGS
jgi:cysteinyl-tRNA synthetase